jgi:hypothetical protein
VRHFRRISTTISIRRARIARIQRSIGGAYAAWRNEFMPAFADDYPFVISDAGKAAYIYFLAAAEASQLLKREEERFRAEEAAKGLKVPSKGKHAKAATTPEQQFLFLAEVLWAEERGVPTNKRGVEYATYRELLWEIVTGERFRSFAKANRSDKSKQHVLCGVLRTRHER